MELKDQCIWERLRVSEGQEGARKREVERERERGSYLKIHFAA